MGIRGKEITAAEIETMFRWRRRGLSIRGIAKMLGRSPESVRKYVGVKILKKEA